ncbi:hypothetical protein Tco_1092319 [Tanacetum coccineum]|uniref:Reverse transcriptase Ty1/copia-type domain-containing protein n=1 Tax=Tanacetum coccineum TaxID=301880 RepID=A0ABQ5I9M2_9ASTR
MNARYKKPKVVQINTRKPTKNAKQSIAKPHKITIASDATIEKSSRYFRMLYEKTSKTWTWWIEKQHPSGYIWRPKVKNDNALASDSSTLDVKSRFTTNSEPLKKMDPICPTLHHTQSTLNVQPTLEPIIPPTNVNVEEINTDKAENAPFEAYECINPFSSPRTKDAENPSKPVQTRRQHATNPDMCMFTLIVSKAEPKNIKETMTNHAWIKAMQEELRQFNRLNVWSLMYLTSSKPELVQAVCYYAHYQARPTKKHLKEVEKIFRYLKKTIHMGLWYPKDSGFELIAFSDVDHAGCLDTRKSTSGGIQFLGDKLVDWMSKKQDCTTMSTAEAKTEYQLEDMFTKALSKERFEYLVS